MHEKLIERFQGDATRIASLYVLSLYPEIGALRLSKFIGSSKSTAQRIISEFCEQNIIARDDFFEAKDIYADNSNEQVGEMACECPVDAKINDEESMESDNAIIVENEPSIDDFHKMDIKVYMGSDGSLKISNPYPSEAGVYSSSLKADAQNGAFCNENVVSPHTPLYTFIFFLNNTNIAKLCFTKDTNILYQSIPIVTSKNKSNSNIFTVLKNSKDDLISNNTRAKECTISNTNTPDCTIINNNTNNSKTCAKKSKLKEDFVADAQKIYDVYKTELKGSKGASRAKINIIKILSGKVLDEYGKVLKATVDDLIGAVINYKSECLARSKNGQIDRTYIKEPANFFGTDRTFMDYFPERKDDGCPLTDNQLMTTDDDAVDVSNLYK